MFSGQAGWGIAWYINDTLIPELVVERGRTYTFLIYGGDNPADGANYHPFYITDSINGGRLLNTPEQRTVSIYSSGIHSCMHNIWCLPYLFIHTIIHSLFLLCVTTLCRLKLYFLALTAVIKQLEVRRPTKYNSICVCVEFEL